MSSLPRAQLIGAGGVGAPALIFTVWRVGEGGNRGVFLSHIANQASLLLWVLFKANNLH